jgi:hypothetical protein
VGQGSLMDEVNRIEGWVGFGGEAPGGAPDARLHPIRIRAGFDLDAQNPASF